MVPPVQVLDSLGGRSSLVRDVTMDTGLSEVVLLIVLEIWPMRSSTQPAERRASASWSQHSSMVSHIWLKPGCLSQESLMAGRIFLCTTTSCRSSREGCWPISSSNGSMYSPTVPDRGRKGHKMDITLHSRVDI